MTIDQFFRGFTGRLVGLMLLVAFLITLLVFRLWFEQLRLGTVHQKAISKQSIRRIRIPPIRGRIFSNDGKLFTDNKPAYDAYFHVHELRQPGRSGMTKTLSFLLEQINRTASIIGRKSEIQQDLLKRHAFVYPALPFRGFSSLNDQELALLFELMPGIPGLEISTRMVRAYPMGEIGAHMIGFVGKKDPNLEEERKSYSYFLPELSGRSGLEAVYEDYLNGKGGAKLIRIDSVGFFYEDFGNIEPGFAGYDLFLSIDSKAQTIAQNLLNGKKGAIVVVECNTGAALALASSPSYNLEELSAKSYTILANDKENRPLLNRCVSGSYSPGSILKPLIAMAILEEGTCKPGDVYHCLGYYKIGETKIRCSHTAGHGPLTLVEAVETSCNSFFIRNGVSLGIDRIGPYLIDAGIGHKTGIELDNGGSKGILPSREYKRSRQNQNWNAFDTALISIGQGLVTISPLHAAMYTAAIANGGNLYRPYIVKAIKDPRGYYLKVTKPEIVKKLKCSKRNLELIRNGMELVVSGARGTAPRSYTPIIELAGKTGTAEIGSGRNKRKNTWFISYGPLTAPKYAMAILIEDGNSGGTTAAPLAKMFFEQYLSQANHGKFGNHNSEPVAKRKVVSHHP